MTEHYLAHKRNAVLVKQRWTLKYHAKLKKNQRQKPQIIISFIGAIQNGQIHKERRLVV